MAIHRRSFLVGLGTVSAVLVAGMGHAQQPTGRRLVEPVYRVARNNNPATNTTPHPLDPGIELARRALDVSRANYNDYTATLVKRERVDGELGQPEYMFIKVRNRKLQNGQLVSPLSVYLAFLSPASVKGRECIYVENRNNGKVTAHEGGMKGRFLPTVELNPNGMFAMQGQRYPITDIGLENLIVKLIERGETARQYSDVQASFFKNAKVKDRECTVLQVTQPTRRQDLDFYQAQIFIDDELQVPIRYVAYDWPANEGEKPGIIEEYTYLDVKVNVGLTDADFDPGNPDYGF